MPSNNSILSSDFDFLKNWWYQPYTYWLDTFGNFFHPQIYFGCNIDDVKDEQQVLNTVGSYGKQLSQILKVIVILKKYLPEDKLTEEEKLILQGFEEYKTQIDTTLAESRGPKPQYLDEGYLQRLDKALQVKKSSNQPEFEKLVVLLKAMVERLSSTPAPVAPPDTVRK
ncbi:MAG TPA: hypothetical protein VH186_14435 [Chloroflexia bacterium]|nr:hypothetical protein [Chloroflexia bacterium]